MRSSCLSTLRPKITVYDKSVSLLTSTRTSDGTSVSSDRCPPNLGRPLVVEPKASPFNQCPAEVYDHIFSLACLDDGTTGRSLSRVSKHIRHVSRGYRYQSVAVHSVDAAQTFASTLQQLAPTERRVRHLYVHCDCREIYRPLQDSQPAMGMNFFKAVISRLTSYLTILSSLVRLFYTSSQEMMLSQDELVSPPLTYTMYMTVRDILTIIGPSLQTVSIFVQPGDWRSTHSRAEPLFDSLPLFPPLSGLQEMSMVYARCCPMLPMQRWQRCESLKYVNLAGCDTSLSPIHLLEAIPRFAPSVTHVQLPWSAKGWDESTSSPSARRPLPPTVQKVYIRAPPRPLKAEDVEYWNETMNGYRELESRDSRVILVEVAKEEKEDFILKREWLERMLGGDGCWSSRPTSPDVAE